MGGGWYTPLGGLSFAAHRWVPQTGWFFMSLFLAILELSWTGHFWIFFWKFQKFSRRQIFPKSIQRGDPSIQKSKKSKKAFFCCKSYFFYLNMNSTCSQLSFEVSNMSVAQNFLFFTFFAKFWLKSFVVENFWNFWNIFKNILSPLRDSNPGFQGESLLFYPLDQGEFLR